MDNNYLTVKQFADRAGVSTQRIYQLLAKSLQPFCKVENGTKYLSVEGLKVFDKEPMQELDKDLQSNLQEVASPETELLKETIEALRQQLTVKDDQLSAKDEQLAAKDKQLADLTAALLSAQEQHKALTDALTAAQALHAGTIQQQLTERSEQSEETAAEVSEAPSEDAAASSEEVQEQTPRKRGFFARLFGKD